MEKSKFTYSSWGLFIAELGIWFGVIGMLEFLQQHVHSFFLQSVILVSGILFSIVIGPFAGKVVDQTSKKLLYFGYLLCGLSRYVQCLLQFGKKILCGFLCTVY